MPVGAIGAAGTHELPPHPAALARRLEREHDLRRLQHLVRACRRRPALNAAFLTMANGERPHLRDHQPARIRDHDRDRGGGRHDGTRPELPRLDRPPVGCRRQGAMRSPRRGPAAARAAGAVADAPARRLHLPPDAAAVSRAGTTLLAAARRLGVDLDSVCGGRGICTRCQVRVSEGEFAKHGIVSALDHLTETHRPGNGARSRPDGSKEGRIGSRARRANRRATSSPTFPETSQVHRQIVRKRAEVRNIRIDPAGAADVRGGVRLRTSPGPPPTSDGLQGEPARRIRGARRGCRPARPAQAASRPSNRARYRATAFVRDRRRLVDLRPGYRDRVYGLAVDVGSTTLAVHLCDLLSGEVLPPSVG